MTARSTNYNKKIYRSKYETQNTTTKRYIKLYTLKFISYFVNYCIEFTYL